MNFRCHNIIIGFSLLAIVCGSMIAIAQPPILTVPNTGTRPLPLNPTVSANTASTATVKMSGVVLLQPEFQDGSSDHVSIPQNELPVKQTSSTIHRSAGATNPIALLAPIEVIDEVMPDSLLGRRNEDITDRKSYSIIGHPPAPLPQFPGTSNVSSNRPLKLEQRDFTPVPGQPVGLPLQTAVQQKTQQKPLVSISQTLEKYGEAQNVSDQNGQGQESGENSSDSGETDDNDEADDEESLRPLEDELRHHGGSYLYQAEGDKTGWPYEHTESHHHLRRLPESWQKPRPLTAYQEFLGADPIHPRPGLEWFGEPGFHWEPRFVGYGSYQLFGLSFDEGNREQNGIGHQLLIDLDLRLTGTERFHVQFRPLGRKNSGGSFYQFDSPQGYNDNSTLIPDRYWFEAEFFSLFGQTLNDPFTPRDYHVVVGKFPMTMHNSLLMNDDILGIAINKNTLYLPPLSNANIQVFYGVDDVDSAIQPSPEVVGVNTALDYRHTFIETTLAYLYDNQLSDRDSGYAAGSVTQFFGSLSLAGRALAKWGDDDGTGDGQLFVVESNYSRRFTKEIEHRTGFEHAVYYANAFRATSGWNSISGGNFDRIRSTFEVNPLVNVSQFGTTSDVFGAALGVQLFCDDDDQSITPELAWQDDTGEAVWGMGLGWMKKVGRRTFVEARGIQTWSDDPQRRRQGIFGGTTVLF